jgi:hypothetical protein
MRIAILAFASLLAGTSWAQDIDPSKPEPAASTIFDLQAVTIEATKNPLSMKVSRLLLGVEAFETGRRHAPEAVLRFVVSLTKPVSAPLKVWVQSGDERFPVAVDEKGEFSIPALSPELLAGAILVANVGNKSGKFRAIVRTAGYASDTRRLGDLRLECAVLWAIEREDVSLILRAAFGAAGGVCNSSKLAFSFPSPKALRSAEVRDNERTSEVRVLQGGRGYWPPLYDTSLSDNAIVNFMFADA